MANIKSSKKRIRVAEKKRVQNKSVKSEINTFVKKFNKAVEANDVALATELHATCVSLVDTAAGNNVLHKNKANRQKAQFAKKLAKVTA